MTGEDTLTRILHCTEWCYAAADALTMRSVSHVERYIYYIRHVCFNFTPLVRRVFKFFVALAASAAAAVAALAASAVAVVIVVVVFVVAIVVVVLLVVVVNSHVLYSARSF